MNSKLETTFAYALRASGLPAGEREYCFILRAAPEIQQRYQTPRTRKPRAWRFDWAWPELMLAVECDGGLQRPDGGRHNTRADAEKLAAARTLGWLVVHYTVQQLRDSQTCMAMLAALMRDRKGA